MRRQKSRRLAAALRECSKNVTMPVRIDAGGLQQRHARQGRRPLLGAREAQSTPLLDQAPVTLPSSRGATQQHRQRRAHINKLRKKHN
jgi:hypothetical protein